MAANDTWPVWSPNGRRIAFQANRDGSANDVYVSANDVYVMNADGTNPTRLTSNPTSDDYPFIE